jgi:ferredoxin-2, mitochondrial
MIKITVIDREDVSHELDAPTDMGLSIMELCKSYELPVEGTCGGMALCASCHVYVLSDHPLHEPTDDELNMLDQAFFVKPNSRLGCQIKLNDDELDGLQLRLAPVSK